MLTPEQEQLVIRYAVHRDKRSDLPQEREKALYCWKDQDGTHHSTTLANTQRQFVEQLRHAPVCAASRMQLAATVNCLREKGLPIHTVMSRGPDGVFGVYTLTQKLSRYDYQQTQ